jgi:hypothetical protein
MITKFGKRFLTNIVAGNVSNLGKDLAIGIDYTLPTENDTRLGFEFYRAPVSFGSTDIQTINGVSTYSVIFKSTIPQDVEGYINEIGIYPSEKTSINNYDSKFITDFNSYSEWENEDGFHPAFDSDNSRIGSNLLIMQSNIDEGNQYYYNVDKIDLSGYSVNDTLRLSYYKLDENLNTILIRFHSSDTEYFEATINIPSGLGHKITNNIPMSEIFSETTATAPDKTSIIKIGIVVIPNESTITYVGLDGLRINDEDTFDPIYGLVSRSSVINQTSISGASGQNTVSVDSVKNIFVGQPVSGTGIGLGAVVTEIDVNTVTLSINNSGTVSGIGNFYGIKKIAGRSLDIEYRLDLGWNI